LVTRKCQINYGRVNKSLDESVAVPGDILEGKVYITDSDVEQEIDQIYLYVATKYKYESGDSPNYQACKLLRYLISQSFTPQPIEEKSFSFSTKSPYYPPPLIFICLKAYQGGNTNASDFGQ
jgi:sporulation-control protein